MTAGLHQRVNIFRPETQPDDSVGGAVLSDVTLYENIPAVIASRMPSQMALEAGLETPRLYDLTLRQGISDIRERDEVEVVFPFDDVLIGIRLRVTGIQHGKRRRSRSNTKAVLTRVYESRKKA